MSINLILGLSNGGLFLARQIRLQWPEAEIYAIGSPHDVGKYSNAINQFFTASDEDEIVSSIFKVLGIVQYKRIKAYMCSNPMLESIVLRHPEIFDFLEFENSFELYHQIVDKNETDILCRELNIPRPVEYGLLEHELSSIHFPVVVKPLEKTNTLGASKCAYIKTPENLLGYFAQMGQIGIERKQLVCQQCIEGDNRWEYGYGGYFQEGKAIVDICFYQLFQVPQGLCCYCREITDDSLNASLREIVRPFLEKSKYNGFLEFDVKQDKDTKTLYVLDINPRPWRSVDILSVKLGNSTIFSPFLTDFNAIWRYPYRELFRKKNKNNPSSLKFTLSNKKTTKTQYMSYDKNDLKPFIHLFINDVLDFLQRIKKKIYCL